MERVKGIEPSRPAWKAGALPLSYTRKIKNGRSSRIRTCDPLVPSQVRYQTALCPVINYLLIIANPVVDVNHYFCRVLLSCEYLSATKIIISSDYYSDKYFFITSLKIYVKNMHPVGCMFKIIFDLVKINLRNDRLQRFEVFSRCLV